MEHEHPTSEIMDLVTGVERHLSVDIAQESAGTDGGVGIRVPYLHEALEGSGDLKAGVAGNRGKVVPVAHVVILTPTRFECKLNQLGSRAAPVEVDAPRAYRVAVTIRIGPPILVNVARLALALAIREQVGRERTTVLEVDDAVLVLTEVHCSKSGHGELGLGVGHALTIAFLNPSVKEV
jgi:hypothetical protein